MKILLLCLAVALPRAAAAADVSTAPVESSAVAVSSEAADLVFPPPPDKPRVRFVRMVTYQDDLVKGAKKRGFFAKLIALFSGGDARSLLFTNPYGIWVKDDVMYVTDTVAQRVVVVDLAKGTVKSLGDKGDESLKAPVGVTVDAQGIAYATDAGDGTVKAYAADGNLLWSSNAPGGQAGGLSRPAGIVFAKDGDLLVADSGNRRIVEVSPKDGKFVREMCVHANKEYYALPNPSHLWALNKDGEFLVSDPLAGRVHVFSSTGAATGGFGEPGDTAGYLARPRGVAADSDGNIHVVDAVFSRVQIFDRAGQLLLWYGKKSMTPGGMAIPAGIFIDKNDRIYVADTKNKRVDIFQYITYPEEHAAKQ